MEKAGNGMNQTGGNKEKLLRYCGSIEQIAGVRPVTYEDGRASGLRCALLYNGLLEFPLMLDKCLDPAWLRYKGMNLSFLTKPGLQGRSAYDTAGEEAVRSIMGGAMFTCGLDHVHGHRRIAGTEYPTHGRMRTTPAEKIGMDAYWDGDAYKLRVTGEMRQARIFGENIVLRRTVETEYHSAEIIFRDEIENQGFQEEPLCFLYHCNAAYPFMVPGCRVILPSISCIPRDEDAEKGMEKRMEMEEPLTGRPEQVFQHILAADESGNTFGALVNDDLELALCFRWNIRQIPYLTQWKSCASGDYVMALEPTNCGFDGRAGQAQVLQPMETHVNELHVCIVEGREAIRSLETECSRLVESHNHK